MVGKHCKMLQDGAPPLSVAYNLVRLASVTEVVSEGLTPVSREAVASAITQCLDLHREACRKSDLSTKAALMGMAPLHPALLDSLSVDQTLAANHCPVPL